MKQLLMAAHGFAAEEIEVVVIKTTADRVLDRALKEIGGKGLFTKELEEALLSNEIDLALHCVKDMAVAQPEGLVADCYLAREDVRDAFISHEYDGLADLPEGAVLGTSSMRRKAQALHRRPDLQVVNFRGNVQSRLRKLDEGVAVATFLAAAGLNRLGMQSHARNLIEVDDILPAVGQGALVIERRENDSRMANLVAPLHHTAVEIQMQAERTFLGTLEGSCETPIAGLAEFTPQGLRLRGEILRTDGSEVIAGELSGALSDAAEMGAALARELLSQAGPGFFDWKRPV